MKSTRRHELKQNLLAAEIQKSGQWIKAHSVQLSWALLGVVVVVVGVVWYVTAILPRGAQTRRTLYDAVLLPAQETALAEAQVKGLQQIAECDDEELAAEASYQLGINQMIRLMGGWYVVTAEDRQKMSQDAQRWLDRVIEKFPRQQAAVAKARYALGKLAESEGRLDDAQAYYEAIRSSQAAYLAGQPVLRFAEDALTELPILRQQLRLASRAPRPEDANAFAEPNSLPRVESPLLPLDANMLPSVEPNMPAPAMPAPRTDANAPVAQAPPAKATDPNTPEPNDP